MSAPLGGYGALWRLQSRRRTRLAPAGEREPPQIPPAACRGRAPRRHRAHAHSATFERANEWLDAVVAGQGVPVGRLVLAGFSQGAVMSYSLGLAAGRPRPAAILAMSGCTRRLTSVLAAVEAPRTALLKTGAAETIPRAEALLGFFDLVELDGELRGAAARAAPRELRTLDAIHPASGLTIRDEIDAFVVYDRRLAAAARAAGLPVATPGSAERERGG